MADLEDARDAMKDAINRKASGDPLYGFLDLLANGSAFACKHLARSTAKTMYEEEILLALLAEDALDTDDL